MDRQNHDQKKTSISQETKKSKLAEKKHDNPDQMKDAHSKDTTLASTSKKGCRGKQNVRDSATTSTKRLEIDENSNLVEKREKIKNPNDINDFCGFDSNINKSQIKK